MFDYQHYVPVMRMKTAELRALHALDPILRSVTTPLLECPPRVLRGCETAAKIERRATQLVNYLTDWAGRSLFLDLSMLPASVVPMATDMVVRQMMVAGVRPIMVVTLKCGEQSAHVKAVQHVQGAFGASVCLRLSPEELRLAGVEDLVDRRLKQFGAAPATADLVIDRGYVDGQSFTYDEFAGLIPWPSKWRTTTCLAGSFPVDLSRMARGQIHRLKRHEWQQWRSLQSWVGRRPAFGDYAIQHVLPREPVAVPNYSASIRYTVENEFVVLRGEGVLNEGGPGFGQYNGWATMLMEMPEFFGPSFSAGDRYVAELASDWRSSGNAQTWLQAGFSHHLTATALQVVGQLQMARRASASKDSLRWSALVDVAHPQPVA